jgi:hypothetical protein
LVGLAGLALVVPAEDLVVEIEPALRIVQALHAGTLFL